MWAQIGKGGRLNYVGMGTPHKDQSKLYKFSLEKQEKRTWGCLLPLFVSSLERYIIPNVEFVNQQHKAS